MKAYDEDFWSVRLGHWGEVRVRLHVFLLLFAAIVLYLSWFTASSGVVRGIVGTAAISLVILLCSIICHELGHYFASARLGGTMRQCVLLPWGGLSTFSLPRDPISEFIVHLAGPLANLAICLLCIPLLLTLDSGVILGLLHPLRPVGVADGPLWCTLLRLTFWINWLLVMINMIPAYPFDGGQAFRAAVARFLGRRQAILVVARLAQVAAFALVVVAWFVRDIGTSGLIPVWFALVLLAIFLFFSAKYEPERREREPADDDVFGYDFSQGYTSLERSAESSREQPSSPISQWLEQRRQARQRREQELEADEERRVDDVLARLHEYGLESLSEEDRALLQRVSARYRNRMGDGL